MEINADMLTRLIDAMYKYSNAGRSSGLDEIRIYASASHIGGLLLRNSYTYDTQTLTKNAHDIASNIREVSGATTIRRAYTAQELGVGTRFFRPDAVRLRSKRHISYRQTCASEVCWQ